MSIGTILLIVGFIAFHFLMHRGHGSHGQGGHGGHGGHSGHGGGGCCGGGHAHDSEPDEDLEEADWEEETVHRHG